jgi:hypothetical protein
VKKKQTPLFPIVIAGVIAGFLAIPYNGTNAEPWIFTGLTIAVGAFARKRALRERAPQQATRIPRAESVA